MGAGTLATALAGLPVFAQDLGEQGEDQILAPLHPDGERLRHEDVRETVDRETREAVGLPEDDAAAAQILRSHHGPAVIPGVADAAAPEGRVECVVGVSGDEAQPDLALPAVEAGAEVLAALAHGVGQGAVFGFRALREDLLGVDPGVALLDPARAFLRDGEKGVVPRKLHGFVFLWLNDIV